MKHKVTKAIFPVAGQGTRFLPATKSIPKEIMTLVDRPLVQYAIDEARAAGIKEFIFVTSRGKGALEDYFDEAPELERTLRKQGKAELLSVLKSTNMESGAIAYIRQHQAMGLGHAVWCARRLIGDEPFAVLLPDDVISAQKPCLQQMVEAYEETGASMVAAMRVASKDASSYGMLDIEKEQGPLVSVRGMVEKPPLGHERPTLNPNVAPPFRAMSPRQNPRCYSCRFHPGQTGKSRAGWPHWIKRIRRSCGAILVKDRCVAGKTSILITTVSLLCTTLSPGPMKYFASMFYQSKMIAMQNCAKGCAGCTTSLFPSIQMIRPYQPGKFANASANS
ncbi:MAG: NTP transferase domain-containing protein [Planktomarina sp.]|nr:NTP transferase domain-containing protein [Planktomarina sp.]